MRKIKQKLFQLPKLLWELNTNVFWLRIIHFKCQHPQSKDLERNHGIYKLPVKCSLKNYYFQNILIDTGDKDEEDIITTQKGGKISSELEDKRAWGKSPQ